MTTYVVIPTIGESPHLRKLVTHCLDEGVDRILLTVNRPGINLDVPQHDSITVCETHGKGRSIYIGWNLAITEAKEQGAEHLAILNDDIVLHDPDSLRIAGSILDEHPNLVVVGFNYGKKTYPEIKPCTGSFRHGGIGGFAFMVDVPRCPLVDEQFEWWGGDDDLFFQVHDAGGRLAIANMLTVDHVAETTAYRHSWTHEARIADRERFAAKYGKARTW